MKVSKKEAAFRQEAPDLSIYGAVKAVAARYHVDPGTIGRWEKRRVEALTAPDGDAEIWPPLPKRRRAPTLEEWDRATRLTDEEFEAMKDAIGPKPRD